MDNYWTSADGLSNHRPRDNGQRRDPQPNRDPGRNPKKEFNFITAVTKTLGTWKNAAAAPVNRSRSPSIPIIHHPGPSSAPGMKLPPLVYSEGRTQPASSSYGNNNAPADADVYEIRAPPPWSSQDGDTGPSPNNLVMAVMGVKSAVNQFAKTLISDMNKHPEDLKHLKQRIRDEVQGDVDRVNHWKFLVQAFVCQRMFEGFESENGFFGIEQFDGLKMSALFSFQDFTKYKDKAVTMSELFARGSEDRSFLGRYCFKKFKSICVDPVTNQSFANYQEEWRWVEGERHLQSEFYQSFLKVAVSVWLLHRLVHSFEQGWTMLGWETFPNGNKFQKKSMESVVTGGSEDEDDETGTDVNTVVGFLVIPGFQVSRSVVKCEVYVRKSNQTDGKITEVRSCSLEKSFSDKTPAKHQATTNYQTPPPDRSSMDRSPGSRDSFRNSSDHSGHPSSRGAGDVENSRLFWSNNQPQQSSAPTNYQTSGHSEATANCPTPPPKSSIDRSPESRDSLRSSLNCRARSYLEDAEESAKAVQKMFDLLKFNNEQCSYLCDKLSVVVQSARSVLMVSGRKEVGTTSRKDDTDFVKPFELLMVLGKQIESFVEGCCNDKWVQAAMVLTNVSEYVSSLGFNLNLCEVAIGKDHAASGCLTLDEVDGIKKSEAEVVKVKASVDAKVLIEKAILALNCLHGEDRDLASYLLQRLLEIKRIPTSGSGTILSNLFAWVKVGKQVGRGASATVYKAKWLGTRVAMKTFEGSENVEFEKEVEILSLLRHPNITSMFCFTKDTRSCSIVMELMDGDLNQLINQLMRSGDSRPFPILEAVDIMLQIGEGVKYLHDQRIVHRDLKSGNILYKAVQVKDAGIRCVHVKVADFGISKGRLSSTTYSDLSCNTGTNRWMPPEVIGLLDENQGGSPSNAVRLPKYPFKLDTYSFGLVCYEILSGRLPFWECGNPMEVKRRILNKERPILPCKPSECPLMLKALIEKCWSHEPEERPAFGVICTELKYIKYLLMIGGSMKYGVDSKITEVRSRNLEKSFTDKTPANYQTPSNYQTSAIYQATPNNLTLPPNSSIDSSPGSRDIFRRSSNYSGHSSSRGAENVENSRLFWSNDQPQENSASSRSARSMSGQLESRGHFQTTSYREPTPTFPILPFHIWAAENE